MQQAARPLDAVERNELDALGIGVEQGAARVTRLGLGVPPTTGGLWRVSDGRRSIVCKLVRYVADSESRWAPADDARDPFYWRREALVYENGIADHLGSRLRGARCFGVFPRGGNAVSIWLEDLSATTPATVWPLSRYGEAAFDLGAAQGAALNTIATQPEWLSRDWLRAYLARVPADARLLDDDSGWRSHPLARRYVVPAEVSAVRKLLDAQPWLLARLNELPQTLCHLDLHPHNMFADPGGTVLIDWAYAGRGAIGEDLGNLHLDAAFDFHVPPHALDDLRNALLEGYVDGLAAADAPIARDLVDLGASATACAKYLWILPAMLRALVDDRDVLNRRPIAEAFATWSQIVPHILRSGQRTFTLARQFGIALPG